ncbi:hypothetical protein GCM10028862_20620 [Luteimonas pelagia]
MDSSQIITAIKDIVLAVAAAATAFVAVRGINKWHTELTGKAAFDAARALTRATYRLRDEIASCRSPLVTGNEFPDGFNESRTPDAQEKAKAWAHVYQNRWEPVKDAALEFDTQALEAEALWGANIRNKTDVLRKMVTELFVAIGELIDDKAHGGDSFRTDPAFGKQIRSTVSASPKSKDNDFSNRMALAAAGIEAEMREHLGKG